jgi:molybdopterin biosynthesis enzyme MoaB
MNMSLFDGKFTEEDDEYDEIKDLQQKVIQLEADLLQTQASEARLRERIEAIWKAYSTVVLNGGTGFARHLPEPIQAAKKALSTSLALAEINRLQGKPAEGK